MKTRPAAIAMTVMTAVTAAATCLVGPASAFAQPVLNASLPLAEQDALWNSRGCVDDARGEWFRDAKFGAIIHFGMYSHLGGYYEGKGPYRPAEQIMGLGDRRSVISPADYKAKVAGHFNPTKFDAAEWVRLMKAAGQKYVILTTKHHDGFCMFQTETTSFNIMESTPFKRDIVRELADECRKQGLEFCLYYSIGDWVAHEVPKPGYPTFKEYMYAQIRELLTNYGDIKLFWFDNWWYVNDQWKNDEAHAKDIYSFTRSINPQMLVNDRCGVGVESDHGDYATPENQLKGSRQSRYFEVVMTNTADDNWGWVKGATNYRKPADLIRNLIDCTSKGGNFVLNVGPTAEGEFPPEHVAILEAMGAWTSRNGEAIYGARPAPEAHTEQTRESACYGTRSKNGDAIYLHVVKWPEDGQPIRVKIDRPGAAAATLLDPSLGDLDCSAQPASDGASSTLTIKPPAKPDPSATVIKVVFSRSE